MNRLGLTIDASEVLASLLQGGIVGSRPSACPTPPNLILVLAKADIGVRKWGRGAGGATSYNTELGKVGTASCEPACLAS